MTLREIPHVRVVKPDGTQGLLVSPRETKFFLTLPGEEERPIPAMQAAELFTAFNEVERVKITMLATLEIVYEPKVDPTTPTATGGE